jgi:hypothetical protein
MSLAYLVVADPLDCAFPLPAWMVETSTPVIPAYSAIRISFQVPPENVTVTVFAPALMFGATYIDTTLPSPEFTRGPAANE